MRKNKNDVWNLVFSAFLIAAFLVCSGFFIGMINESFAHDAVGHSLMTALVFILFGLLLFYATRVGDGKQVMRFSPSTLLLMVLPALYVMIASAAAGWPLHDVISQRREIVNIAAVIFGYGLPYTFLSGFELRPSDSKKPRTPDAATPKAAVRTDTKTTENTAAKNKEDTETTSAPV